MNIKQFQSLHHVSDSNIKWAKHCLERASGQNLLVTVKGKGYHLCVK